MKGYNKPKPRCCYQRWLRLEWFVAILVLSAFVIFTSVHVAYAQTSCRIDSLKSLIKKSKPDTSQVRLMLKISHEFLKEHRRIQDLDRVPLLYDSARSYALRAATICRQRNHPLLLVESLLASGQKKRGKDDVTGIPFVREALSLSRALNDQRKTAESLLLLGVLYPPISVDTAIKYMEEGIEIFKRNGYPSQAAGGLEDLADVYLMFGSGAKAKRVQLEAVNILRTLKSEDWVLSLTILGLICSNLGDLKEALGYEFEVMRHYERKRDSVNMAAPMSGIARIYMKMRDYERSIYYFERVGKMDSARGNIVGLFRTKWSIISMYCQQNNITRARLYAKQVIDLFRLYPHPSSVAVVPILAYSYSVLGEYKTAEYWYLKILKHYEAGVINVAGTCELYAGIGELYTNMKKYDAAANYLKKALALNEKARRPAEAVSIHTQLFKIDSTQRKLSSALWHYQRARYITDSLFNETKNRQFKELQIQYETEIKEDSIRLMDKNILLLTEQNRLQQSNLQRANLIKNVTIGGVALALAITVLLYRLYKQKQRNNNVITQKNEQLQHFLKEKEWLLKEIHHRVKNNLHIVMSLLNSLSAYIDNEPALAAIHDSQHRVNAISLIHQKLYNTENVSSIDISFYIRELVTYLSDSFGTGQRIRFELNVENLLLDVTQSVPLGLILNEAITNAIKYAFPDGRNGVISISLVTMAHEQIELTISDNGIGIPHDFNMIKPGSLGMRLITGLSEDLDGKFSLESTNGTILRISFAPVQGLTTPSR